MGLPQLKEIDSDELDLLVEKARRASDFLKALAHESRLLILCSLARARSR